MISLNSSVLTFHDGGRYHIETDLRSKSMDWFLSDNDLRHERVKVNHINFIS